MSQDFDDLFHKAAKEQAEKLPGIKLAVNNTIDIIRGNFSVFCQENNLDIIDSLPKEEITRIVIELTKSLFRDGEFNELSPTIIMVAKDGEGERSAICIMFGIDLKDPGLATKIAYPAEVLIDIPKSDRHLLLQSPKLSGVKLLEPDKAASVFCVFDHNTHSLTMHLSINQNTLDEELKLGALSLRRAKNDGQIVIPADPLIPLNLMINNVVEILEAPVGCSVGSQFELPEKDMLISGISGAKLDKVNRRGTLYLTINTKMRSGLYIPTNVLEVMYTFELCDDGIPFCTRDDTMEVLPLSAF